MPVEQNPPVFCRLREMRGRFFIFGAKAGRPGRVLLEMNDAQRIKTKWKNIA